jgi:hypothetical protein
MTTNNEEVLIDHHQDAAPKRCKEKSECRTKVLICAVHEQLGISGILLTQEDSRYLIAITSFFKAVVMVIIMGLMEI